MTATAQRRGFVLSSDAQAKITLAKMHRVVDAAVHNTDFLLWAREQIRRAGADLRDQRSLAAGVVWFLDARLKFVRDPLGIEAITPPLTHMRALDKYRVVAGDCDDYATLGAALGRAVGLRAVFTIEAFDWGKGPSPYQHVYTTLAPPIGQGAWTVSLDLSRDQQKLPPKLQRRFSTPA